MKDVVCLSTTRFDSIPTRKQNVMKRLSYARVLYFNPQITLAAPLKDKSLFKQLFGFMKKGEDVEKNIKVYDLPPILPFYNKARAINKVNQLYTSFYVNMRIKQNFVHDFLLWCYSPSTCDILKNIKYKNLVYDCIDRHSGYVGMINPQVVDKMEAELASKSDVVFATAIGLYETLSVYNKNIHLIPNGCAYELFSKAHFEKFETPSELQDVKGKVFGFIGMFQECIDYEKIELLAQNRPNDTIIMIGKALPGVNLEKLKSYDNVIIRGLLPQAELPKYLYSIDVCLNVFTSGMLSKDVSPLKFYEYLATGKPIVSTEEPLQVNDFADCVFIAKNNDEFLKLCEKATSAIDSHKQSLRLKYAKDCSWDERVKSMQDILVSQEIF